MARVLVMIPSGEVYDHDCVRWYNYKDIQRSIDHVDNIGDAFVFGSSLKRMNYDKLGVLPIANLKMEDIERLRSEYDYVFLRGSNYVHSGMKWQNTIEEEHWDQGLFDKFNRAWFMTYREMKTFLDENGVDNKVADLRGARSVALPVLEAPRKVA
ncbi:hypothetical protein [Aquabacter cavernae]|uniref:hypothetical protein n=1 Tax=Aquabacter cavernae TaxID=2496029 RepID=UPI00196A455D|nr:hypothetical protein [Aquabacter cavernae]